MISTNLLPDVILDRFPHALHVRSALPLVVLSSAVVGADLIDTRHILNVRVPADYDSDDHAGFLRSTAQALGVTEPFVGLLTAARLDRVQVVREPEAAPKVAAVATVGIRYPTAAGVTPAAELRPGTINILLFLDARLSNAARVNAVITATEAKTLVLVEAGVLAPHGGPASGTGTDAIVVASAQRGDRHEYAGPIAPLGALIGRAVRQAVQQGVAAWQAG